MSVGLRLQCTLLPRSGGNIHSTRFKRALFLPSTSRIITTSEPRTTCCHKKVHPPTPPQATNLSFWTHKPTFHRASINTLRCLIGCSIGDFSALFYLQSAYPHLPPHITMPISMAAGILSSITLETFLLYRGKDQMSFGKAFQTALGMSLISMVAMEAAENVVDYHLTGGVVDVASPAFWGSAVVAMGCGYLAALPYNYWRLRKFGKACH